MASHGRDGLKPAAIHRGVRPEHARPDQFGDPTGVQAVSVEIGRGDPGRPPALTAELQDRQHLHGRQGHRQGAGTHQPGQQRSQPGLARMAAPVPGEPESQGDPGRENQTVHRQEPGRAIRADARPSVAPTQMTTAPNAIGLTWNQFGRARARIASTTA